MLVLLALGGLRAAGAAEAQAPHYRLDPVHTRVMFAISHAGFSNAIGTVSGSSGTLAFDPDDWRGAKLEVSVPLDRVDLGDEKWNRAALASNLLDARAHPRATFVSTRIEPKAADAASVCGNLQLRGVTREVCLDVKLNALKRHPLPPFRRTVGFSATATLSRKAFGIDAWPNVIGDTVELRIEAEATRSRGARLGAIDATDDAGAADDAPDSAPDGASPTERTDPPPMQDSDTPPEPTP
nr:YceI family protein [Luteimonas aquatica]